MGLLFWILYLLGFGEGGGVTFSVFSFISWERFCMFSWNFKNVFLNYFNNHTKNNMTCCFCFSKLFWGLSVLIFFYYTVLLVLRNSVYPDVLQKHSLFILLFGGGNLICASLDLLIHSMEYLCKIITSSFTVCLTTILKNNQTNRRDDPAILKKFKKKIFLNHGHFFFKPTPSNIFCYYSKITYSVRQFWEF